MFRLLVVILCIAISIHGQDVEVQKFDVKDATNIIYYVGYPTTITFDVGFKRQTGAGSVIAVDVYLSTDRDYAPSTVSDAFPATYIPDPFPVPDNENTGITDATATITLDETNCASYTHLCALINDTDTTYTDEDSDCVNLGGQAGNVNCSTEDCTAINLDNGSVTPTAVSHLTVVTLSCDGGYELNGADTLTCLAGEWTGSDQTPTCEEKNTSPVSTVETGTAGTSRVGICINSILVGILFAYIINTL